VGKVLPGKGLYLDMDLKYLGITKPLPNVFQRTIVRRLVELIGNEVGAITAYDGIINARGGGLSQDISLSKTSITTVANAYSSLFRASGSPPNVGTYTNIPGGAVMINTNVGAWSLGLSNPGGSNKKYLITLGFTHAATVNMIILHDLLVAAGNIGISTSPVTINSAALTRYTTGAGVLMTFEITTALSATASNITVTYTNQAGTGSRSTGAIPITTSAIVYRLQPVELGPYMRLQTGDYGVRSVESIVASANNTGILALNLYYPLAFIPGVAANLYIERDSTIQVDGIAEITTAAGVLGCLSAYVLANTTSTGVGTYFMRTCEG